MEHEMRKEINKFKDFLKENSEEKLNISDVSESKIYDEQYLKELIEFIISSFDQNNIDLDNQEEVIDRLYNEWLKQIE
jgi:hypothetical protein